MSAVSLIRGSLLKETKKSKAKQKKKKDKEKKKEPRQRQIEKDCGGKENSPFSKLAAQSNT